MVTVSANEATNALTLDNANATLEITSGAQLSVCGELTTAAVSAIDAAIGTLLVGGGSQTLDDATNRIQSGKPARRRAST